MVAVVLVAIVVAVQFFGPNHPVRADSSDTRRYSAAPQAMIDREHEIELALKAAPVHLRKAATVYVFGRNGYEKIRIGSNGFNCMVNRDGLQNGDASVHPTCWDAEGSRTILPVMLRVGELLALNKTGPENQTRC